MQIDSNVDGDNQVGRDEVIQKLIANMDSPAYLEIGVQNGYTFHAIKATRKVAVDPSFSFDVLDAKANPKNRLCEYHEITSDRYFSEYAKIDEKFDLIFIDGMHTFDQTLRDLMSAVMLIKEDGLILVDDVMPVTYASSISDIVQFSNLRAAEGFIDGSWMGDVYKVVFFIRHYMPAFSFATVQENHGQAVLWRELRKLDTEIPRVETIARLDYSDFYLAKHLFNIKPLKEIEESIKAARTDIRNT